MSASDGIYFVSVNDDIADWFSRRAITGSRHRHLPVFEISNIVRLVEHIVSHAESFVNAPTPPHSKDIS